MSTGGRALAAFDVMVALVDGNEEGLEDSEPISSPILFTYIVYVIM
jgi:hypothetical protein